MNICIFFNFLEEEERYECRIKLTTKYPVKYVKSILEGHISLCMDTARFYDDNEQFLRENLLASDIIESLEIIPVTEINI